VVYIWVRQTVDWADERAVRAQLPDGMPPRVELWDRTFEVPFHAFRHRVREIAALNHSRVEGATATADWDEIPDGALVLPVDDDDWFAPDAARVIAGAAEPGTAGYVWPSRWVEVPTTAGHRLYLIRHRLVPSLKPMWTCTTNNYSMPKRDRDRDSL